MIKEFTQGNDETDSELYCLIGAWAISEEVHKALGMAPTGRAGDLWLIQIKDRPVGFCQIRILKSAGAHIRFLYHTANDKGLVKEAMKLLAKRKITSVFTNDRKTSKTWPEFGFVPVESKRKGEFTRWEKEMLP